MTSETKKWTKEELQIYIMLLCANVDDIESKEEIKLIKSKVDKKTFKKIYKEFCKDKEDKRFQKIDRGIQLHEYSHIELENFRNEINEIFMVDNHLGNMESNLNRILDNILY